MLGGMLYKYDTTFTAPSTKRRIQLDSTFIVGKEAEYTKGSKYYYSEKNYKSFMNEVENPFGAKSYVFYDREEIPELNGGYPTAKLMTNKNEASDYLMFNEEDEFESPVAYRNVIRKTDEYGNIKYDSLFTYVEKGLFGLPISYMGPNGWLYKNAYDRNGRSTYSWHPYDFPEEAVPVQTTSRECIPMHNEVTHVERIVSNVGGPPPPSGMIKQKDDQLQSGIGGSGDPLNIDYAKEYDYNVQADDIIFGNIYILPLDFYTPPEFLDSNYVRPDSVEYVQYKYEATFDYIASATDRLHTDPSVSELSLEFEILSHAKNKNSDIIISSDQLGFEKRIILNSDELDSIYKQYHDLDEIIVQNVQGESNKIKINLNPHIGFFQSTSPGQTVTFRLKTSKSSSKFSVPNKSKEGRPCLTTGFLGEGVSDFTYHVSYDDSARITKVLRKIDDPLHTANSSFYPSDAELEGRYTGGITYHSAGNLVYKTETYIGNPFAPSRIDEVLSEYSGFGLPQTMTDQDGNEFKMFYNDRFEMDSVLFPDGNYMTSYTDFGVEDDMIEDAIQDFHGLIFINVTIDEMGRSVKNYFDRYGRIRRTVVNDTSSSDYPYPAGEHSLTTYYEYNRDNSLKYVINHVGDTTKYFYDDYGRIKYKHTIESGYVSMAHNKIGQVRFTQNQVQADEDKVSFMQYDDLGRPVIAGEARINVAGLSIAEPVEDSGEFTFSRLTDILDPNSLHYTGSEYPTVNTTLLADATGYVPEITSEENYVDYILGGVYNLNLNHDLDTLFFPYAPDIAGSSALVHEVRYYEDTNTVASYEEFEDVSKYPEFVLRANYYDDLPPRKGAIWSNYPSHSNIDSISRGNKVQNLRGRLAATAYRDHGGEPFHYVTFSYDARGRMQSLIRFTENIGYDAVYYAYNSANQIIHVQVSDAKHQFATWYGYDKNGRVDKVWAKVDSTSEYGLGYGYVQYPDSLEKSYDNDDDLIAEYKYNKRGGVEEVIYFTHSGHRVRSEFMYNPRGWLDSMVVKKNFSDVQLFKQELLREKTGLIKSQISSHYDGQNEKRFDYEYDAFDRLTV